MAYHILMQVRASAGCLDAWLAQNPRSESYDVRMYCFIT